MSEECLYTPIQIEFERLFRLVSRHESQQNPELLEMTSKIQRALHRLSEVYARNYQQYNEGEE